MKQFYLFCFLLLLNNSDSPVRSFSLESIVKSQPLERVKYASQTKNSFFIYHEHNFLILPDGKTIVGVDLKSQNTLIAEDITTNKAVSFGNHEAAILTLLWDETKETLFAGNYFGKIIQYKRGGKSRPFSLVKKYQSNYLGIIISSALVGDFAFFAGDFSLFAINISERKFQDRVFETGCSFTNSLRVCHASDSKVYMSIVGENSLHHSDPDLLDVTEIDRMRNIQMKKGMNTSDFKKSRVNTLRSRIMKSVFDLLKEKNKNKVSLLKDSEEKTISIQDKTNKPKQTSKNTEKVYK